MGCYNRRGGGQARNRGGWLAGWLVVMLWWPPGAWGHGDLHERIEAVTAQIAKEPRSAELYLQRGELYRAHQEWDAAQADLDQASVLAPKLVVIQLARARLFLEMGWPLSAEQAVNRFLEKEPRSAAALALRARARSKLGRHLEAARDFTGAITYAPAPDPELYIERAQALTAAGEANYPAALQGLDEGIEKLGPVVTLELHAIDLEVKQGRFDPALARLDQLAAQSPRQETWLARRGEILFQAGRLSQARAAFAAALEAIARLPQSRQQVPAMLELKKRLEEALDSVRPENEPDKK